MPEEKKDSKEIKTANFDIKIEARPEPAIGTIQMEHVEASITHNLSAGQKARPDGGASAQDKAKQGIANLSRVSAQDLLIKSADELKGLIPKTQENPAGFSAPMKLPQEFPRETRETHNLLKSMKIMTAILLGKDKNKELAQMLQTDKSFTSKQIKELEEQGLVKREGEGRETKYVVDTFNLMKFLQTKVVIKWGKKEGEKGR